IFRQLLNLSSTPNVRSLKDWRLVTGTRLKQRVGCRNVWSLQSISFPQQRILLLLFRRRRRLFLLRWRRFGGLFPHRQAQRALHIGFDALEHFRLILQSLFRVLTSLAQAFAFV